MSRLGIFAALALLATSATAQAPTQQAVPRLPSVTLPAELDRVLRDYERLWKAGDGAGLAALFTEDGFIARPSGWIRGREAIREAYQAMASGDLQLRALGYAAGDTVGYIVGAYAYGPTAATQDNGKFTLTLRRQRSARWLIASDLDAAIRR